MRKPGPTPDTSVVHVDFDGARYLILLDKDDIAIEVSYRIMKNRAFYGWRSIWRKGDSILQPKTQVIIDVAYQTISDGVAAG